MLIQSYKKFLKKFHCWLQLILNKLQMLKDWRMSGLGPKDRAKDYRDFLSAKLSPLISQQSWNIWLIFKELEIQAICVNANLQEPGEKQKDYKDLRLGLLANTLNFTMLFIKLIYSKLEIHSNIKTGSFVGQEENLEEWKQ